jgi:hypothetical protein
VLYAPRQLTIAAVAAHQVRQNCWLQPPRPPRRLRWEWNSKQVERMHGPGSCRHRARHRRKRGRTAYHGLSSIYRGLFPTGGVNFPRHVKLWSLLVHTHRLSASTFGTLIIVPAAFSQDRRSLSIICTISPGVPQAVCFLHFSHHFLFRLWWSEAACA